MDDARALQLIANTDDEAKQEIANVFAGIVCEGDLTEQEKNLYFRISEYCNLPDPVDDNSQPDPEEDEEDRIIPAFFSVNFHGMVSMHQSEAEDWDTLGDQLAEYCNLPDPVDDNSQPDPEAAADYQEPLRKRLNEYKRKADIKGFRRGMAPMGLIQRMYGDQALYESVNGIVSEQLDKFINEEKIRVVGEPLPSEDQPQLSWKAGEDFTFKFDLAQTPELP